MVNETSVSIIVGVVVGLLLFAYHKYSQDDNNNQKKTETLIANENEVKTILSMPILRKSSKEIEQIVSDPKNTTKTYYIEYDGYLFNHLAHDIVSLYRIGCEIPQLETAIKEYKLKLKTPSGFVEEYTSIYNHVPKPLDVDDNIIDKEFPTMEKFIKGHLGKHCNYYGIYRKFEHELINNHKNNLNSLVQKWLPQFSHGIGSAAFHSLIHVGYGVSVQSKDVILEGLAYFVHSYLPFAPIENENDDDDFKENNNNKLQLIDILNKIRNDNELKNVIAKNINNAEFSSIDYRGFAKRSIVLSKFGQQSIANYVKLIKPLLFNDFTSKEDLCKWLLKNTILLYTYSGNELSYDKFNDFFLLHAVTSSYCFSEIMSSIDFSLNECKMFVYHYLHSLIACWITQDMPLLQLNNGNDNDDSNKNNDINVAQLRLKLALLIKKNVLMKNADFDDEHVYKLINVVLESLHRNIIDTQVAYTAINKAFQPFSFGPI